MEKTSEDYFRSMLPLLFGSTDIDGSNAIEIEINNTRYELSLTRETIKENNPITKPKRVTRRTTP